MLLVLVLLVGFWLVVFLVINIVWVGFWGVSYIVNLMFDFEIGLGCWSENDFV